MPVVLGVDGARGRWACALWAGPGAAPQLEVADGPQDVRDLAERHGAAVVGLDLPLGLVEAGPRWADEAARRRLAEAGASSPGADRRGAASRVFPTPARPVVAHGGSYAEARALARQSGAPSPSAQAFALFAHVRAWDEAGARWGPGPELVEVHPELSFAAMAGRVLAPKRSARGAQQRLGVLAGERGLGCGADALGAALETAPAAVALDDALDAAAAAWSAHRVAGGSAEPLPREVQRDGDRVIAIWV
ncbi:DUF429 domain-containing protein [uncultured Pseudokineococcus sp.]|uniref:DUF429 domain-containing protein n=1 Tax=uncultured Pseudokineococcus sp. TaxID=1642928 RepID=UPI00260EC10A|nr:DUF429 domain-containing protein [uncultured Pseudokineococcus sp.]